MHGRPALLYRGLAESGAARILLNESVVMSGRTLFAADGVVDIPAFTQDTAGSHDLRIPRPVPEIPAGRRLHGTTILLHRPPETAGVATLSQLQPPVYGVYTFAANGTVADAVYRWDENSRRWDLLGFAATGGVIAESRSVQRRGGAQPW
jgi:hypothetical protein